MATPIRIKRSAVPGKRPTLADLQLGEPAINTYDGRIYLRRDAGVASTIALVTPWTENVGGSIYYNDGNIGIGTTNPTSKLDVVGDGYFTGVITAPQFTTGSGNLGFTANTISGPSVILIDPSPVGVGTTSGAVRILGDLYVDGTQFVVNSSTIELADLRVGIATTVGTNLLLDGGGIGIGSANILKTFTYNNASDSLKSSENIDLALNKTYKINGVDVLSSTTLGSSVVNSSLTSVGTLGQLNVSGVVTATTFNGQINAGVGTITTLSGTNASYVNQTLSGILTASNGIQGIGIQSGGFNIATGIITALNFVGAGNTFSYNSGTKTVEINIGGSQWTFVNQNDPTTSSIYRVNGNVGIGTTNPTSKLTVVGDAFVSGVVTSTTFNGQINAGVGTITTLSGTTATYDTGNFTTGNIVTGVVTTLSGTTATYDTGNFTNGNIVTGVVTTLSGTTATYDTGNFTNGNIVTGVVTTLSGTTATYDTGNFTTGNIVTGIVTTLTSTNATLTNINSIGISTLGVTSVTNLTAQNINNSGITTTNSLNIDSTQVISSARQLQNIASLDATTTATIEAAIQNAPNTFTDLQVTGISTLGVTSTTNLTAQQLNVSGVSTLGVTSITDLLVTGIATFGNIQINSSTNNRKITTINNQPLTIEASSGTIFLDSNVSITGNTNASRIDAGDVTASSLAVSGVTTFSGITTVTGPTLFTKQLNVSGVSTLGITSTTNLTSQQLNVSGLSTFQATLTGTQANFSGIVTSTGGFVGNLTGTATTATNADYINIDTQTSNDSTYYLPFESGIGYTSLYVDTALTYNPGQNLLSATNIQGTQIDLYEGLKVSGISTLGVTSATDLTAQQLNVSGIATFGNLQINTSTNNRKIASINGDPLTIEASSGTIFLDSNVTITGNTSASRIDAGDVTASSLTVSGISTLGVTTVTRLTAQSINSSGIVTGSTFRPSTGYIQAADGTNSFYIYNTTGNVAFQGTIGVGQINSAGGYKALEFTGSTTPTVTVQNNLNVLGFVTTRNAFISTSTSLLAPTAGNYSGERLRLYDFNNNTKTNYAIGVEGSHIWFGVDSNLEAQGFKWYGDTTQVMRLSAAGNLSVAGLITASNLLISGVTTSTGGFVGNLTGIAASATQLVTPRTFEITGDVVASPIFFDGTGNVSLAATIQPNSVGLGTDTTGDYVRDITGTSNQITVTSGTGEGSTPVLSLPSNLVIPQDATVTRDLQVNRNLNVTGNITIGGTSAAIFAETITISDAEIILGYRTDAFNNDASNDNTARHGGIAIASTEGTPLVQLVAAGIETLPSTYKKILWFKTGDFAGLGTDAWLMNYAVGIGSTQFPNGTRLAAGSVQFTENDLSVVRNINASGVGIIPTLSGTNVTYSAGNFTNGYINTGIVTTLSGTTATYTTGDFTTANIVTGVVTTLSGTNATYTTGTLTTLNANTANIVTGVVTTLSGTNATYTTGNFGTANIVTGVVTTISGSNLTYTTGNFGTANVVTGVVTTLTSTDSNFTNINSTGISTLGITSATDLTAQQLNISGISTITDLLVTGISTFTDTTANTLGNVNTGSVQLSGGVGIAGNVSIGSGLDVNDVTTSSGGFVIDAFGPTTLYRVVDGAFTAGIGYTDNTGLLSISNWSNVVIRVNDTETAARFLNNAAVELYYDNSKKFETTGYGATVFGTLQSQQLNVTGISTIVANSSSDALRITQTGSGNVLVVEDETNPDSTPFVVTGTGRVGIGTTNPTSTLTVQGNVLVSGVSTFIGDGTTVGPAIFARRDSNNNAGIKLYGTSSGNFVYSESTFINAKPLVFDASQQESIFFRITGTTKAVIQPSGELLIGAATSTGTASQTLQVTGGAYVSGSIGIGTTNPTSTLTVQGNAYITGVTTSTDFDSLSDINLKTNISQIADPLEKVMQIRGVTFNWKEGNRNSAGVIAQEIEKVLPELVHGEETKTVNYNGLIGLLIECVKKQQEEIEELKKKVN